MSKAQLKDFAATKRSSLPDKKEGSTNAFKSAVEGNGGVAAEIAKKRSRRKC